MLKREIKECFYLWIIPITKSFYFKIEELLQIAKGERYFTKPFWLPKFFLIERFNYFSFKQIKTLAKLKKQTIKTDVTWYSTKSLSAFDYQIAEKGGIVDCNGGIHTTAQSYKNYLKENDLVIKDWSDGSNKKQMQLSDRAQIAKQLNKYI